ncbi:MAG TPA: rhodanese-like domain-containing protein, partial [Acidimicrobiales bacterium]|nr:rhodanese-like domain-containing protein [Acidimicrobiales bacterium]
DTEGRHPLPDPAVFAEGMTRAGIGDGTLVVAYDDAGGVIAARLVWMLRTLGEDAALLDGGLTGWGGPVETGPPGGSGSGVGGAGGAAPAFTPRPWPAGALATLEEVEAAAADPAAGLVLLDARSRDRYEGTPDALDPRAGHIPGARSLPCRDHVDGHGRLLPDGELRSRLAGVGVTAGGPPVVSSCGSGVTACHTLLVLEQVGLPPGRLFAGSWSQWSRRDLPAVTGPAPR